MQQKERKQEKRQDLDLRWNALFDKYTQANLQTQEYLNAFVSVTKISKRHKAVKKTCK